MRRPAAVLTACLMVALFAIAPISTAQASPAGSTAATGSGASAGPGATAGSGASAGSRSATGSGASAGSGSTAGAGSAAGGAVSGAPTVTGNGGGLADPALAAVAGNNCHLPPRAAPDSSIQTSYASCRTCSVTAAENTVFIDTVKVWYCTYNGSTGANDLHYTLAIHCAYPDIAGSGSRYVDEFISCTDCAQTTAMATYNSSVNGPFHSYYCTWDPAKVAYDEHWG